MTLASIIEVVVGALVLVGAILLYRRGGTQGGVLLMVLAALLLIHGFGLMEYRPSATELGR
jgi:hypothetical protein